MKNSLTKKLVPFMDLAIIEARKGIAQGEQPYGAVLLVDGKVFSSSHNTVIESNDQLSHSEVIVLREYLKSLDELKTKPNNLTLVATCEPCIKCFTMALGAGVNTIVFGSNLETAIENGSGDVLVKIMNIAKKYSIEVIEGVMKSECDKLFEEHREYDKKRWADNILTYEAGSKEEIQWMNKALKIGERGMLEKHELPIGVIIVAGDTIISESPTMTYSLNSPITHGDFMALQKAERKVYDKEIKRPLVMYSTLEPHMIGFAAAIKCKLDKVVFGMSAYSDGGACYLKGMVGVQERIPRVVGGVCEEKQYRLFKKFLKTHSEGRVGYDYAISQVKRYEESHKEQ